MDLLVMNLVFLSVVFLCFISPCITHRSSSPPNIIFILTDDQDTVLGGQTPMAQTKKLVGDKGIIFDNMFVTSPLCCPSRSSIFTGRYVHNHNALNNSIDGNCSSPAWQQSQEKTAFPVMLQKKGYKTFFAGKYLNQYGKPAAGGPEHVPPGWDEWNGLVGNSVYYNYSLSVNGNREKHGDTYPSDYLTDVIHKKGRQFLDAQGKLSSPFFMMLSTPACHAPFTPAPQYSKNFSNLTAPRNGSYNVRGKNKHWLIEQTIVPMPQSAVDQSDSTFRNRWRTLLSVDDMVADVVDTLDKKGLLENTYIFFSSDNGYHLGQFGLPYDKRQIYEFDIRVPLMVRGPGIKAGQVSKDIILNIDFGPTFVDLAGGEMDNVDGVSMAPILHPSNSTTAPRQWFLIEHTGEYKENVPGCPQYKDQDMSNCDSRCVCEDSKNNSYGCVVQITDKSHIKYCEFEDTQNFIEIYDVQKDPYEFTNLISVIDPHFLSNLEMKLHYLATCAGPKCNEIPADIYKIPK